MSNITTVWEAQVQNAVGVATVRVIADTQSEAKEKALEQVTSYLPASIISIRAYGKVAKR